MNILYTNLINANNPLSFQSKKIKLNNDKAIASMQEAIVPTVGAAITAATALMTLAGGKSYSLDISEIQRDIDSGMSLRMIANKYNTKVSTIRVFIKKHNLNTKDGQILKTISKEDLQSCIEANMSAKEIAKRYGLSNVGSLSPLYKVFGLSAPTQRKLTTITIDEIIECKKKRMTDIQIAEMFQVSFQFIAAKLKAYGVVARNKEQCRGYTMAEIQDLVNQYPVAAVAKLLGYKTEYFKQLLKKRGISVPQKNGTQSFTKKS